MEDFYTACRALYEGAFGSEPRVWNDALFRLVFPKYLRVKTDGEKPVSMLFSIPYPVKIGEKELPARYLYAVATDPLYRGRGLAKELIREEIERDVPVFLRPSGESLFLFYEKAGLSPLSPVRTVEGEAREGACPDVKHLDVQGYLLTREAFLEKPYAVPGKEFLSLGFLLGGAVCREGEFAAFYERHGDLVYFKEWVGCLDLAPRVAAYLGGARYRLRTPDRTGIPFGMGAGLPRELAFSIALD